MPIFTLPLLFEVRCAICCALMAVPALKAGAGDDAARFSMDDYYSVEKIDAHFHLRTRDTGFVTLAEEDKFRFLNIAVHSNSSIEMEFRLRTTFIQRDAHPDRVVAASAFPMAGWDSPDWQKKTIAHLDDTIAKGARAVKVWKNIGMDFRDTKGQLVMIDDPKFDPIFAHLAKKGIRMIGHLGEPKNCWMPLEKMTVKNDRNYFRANPRYHMFLHPEMPSYEDQMTARDRMLAKNPDLHFIGAHFASLEWSVDELAKFLDRFPKASVDTAARMGQLQYQSNRDRKKVIEFPHEIPGSHPVRNGLYDAAGFPGAHFPREGSRTMARGLAILQHGRRDERARTGRPRAGNRPSKRSRREDLPAECAASPAGRVGRRSGGKEVEGRVDDRVPRNTGRLDFNSWPSCCSRAF